MKTPIRFPAALLALLIPASAAVADVTVLTQHNDERRTGANLGETVLTTANVNPRQFGKLFAYPVDGYVFAQPLYVSHLTVPGKGARNVLFVCTMEDTVYAFDADRNEILWETSFVDASRGITPVPIVDITYKDTLNIHGHVGILSTPVIDPATGTMYLLARTKDTRSGAYIQTLHALAIDTGAEKIAPVVIQASVSGTGKGSKDGVLAFDPKKQAQRPGLALVSGNIIIGWASHEDIGPYHGWVMAYSASDLRQVAVFNATPDGEAGGIWQAGEAPSVDPQGNIYLITGNGDWDGARNYGCSFLKMRGSDLKLLDWFTPNGALDNPVTMNAHDWDLGSTGALLVPGLDYAIGGSKQGLLYVLRMSDLGHSVSGNTQIVQSFQAVYHGPATFHLQGSPIYWASDTQGPLVYLWGENDYGRAFKLADGKLQLPAFSLTRETCPMVGVGQPGAILSLSANGGKPGTGIVWANCTVSGDAVHNIVPGILRAYDAEDLGHQLWNSGINPGDEIGLFAKYVPPTVANGKVYMATFSKTVNVYGLK